MIHNFKFIKQVLSLIFFLFLSIFFDASFLNAENIPPKAVDGILDLRNWNIPSQGSVTLKGQWEFYYNSLLEPQDFLSIKNLSEPVMINVPGSWNKNLYKWPGQGYGTYRLNVLTGPNNKDLGLWIKSISASFRIFVNGVEIARAGTTGITKASSKPEQKNIIADFPSEKGPRQEIIIQVSNFYNRNGGIWEDIILGTDSQVEALRDTSMYYTLFLFGAILIIGIHHIILYSLLRKDISSLIFSLLCFVVALRTLVTGDYYILNLFPGVWWEAVNKIEYLTFFTSVPLFCLFIYNIFSKDFSRTVLLFILAAAAIASVITLATPVTTYIWIAEIFDILTVIAGGYVLLVIALAAYRKRFGAIMLLIGSLIMFVTVLNDVLYMNELIKTSVLSSFGLFLFMVSQSIVMSMRYAKSFYEIEDLSEELEAKSHDLEQKNIRLTDLDRIKDEFLASTSHEIRSPIDGISGLAESMLDGTSGELTQNQTEHLRMILGSAKRLSRLVNDIMDLTRIKKGGLTLNIKPVELRSAIDMVLNLYRRLINAKGLRLYVRIADIPDVMADEDRLQQIINNLLSNALKFTQEGEIEISGYYENNMVIMSVRDTGVGISHDLKESIFSWGEDDSSRTKIGFGLAITKSLIEIQGGTLRVESTPGKGSIFAFSLPAAQEAYKKKHEEIPNKYLASEENIQNAHTGIRVLAVDDDEISLKLLSDILVKEGFSVIALSSGEEAIDYLKHQVIVDAVLLDVMMPRMSGFEVCTEIRKDFGVDELPILFMISKGQAVDIREAFESGINDYIEKPFSKFEVTSRIKSHVNLCKLFNEQRQLKNRLNLKEIEREKELETVLDEYKRANDELKALSLQDGLTGVRNRRFFDELYKSEWDRALREQYPISILMIDIDHFKDINDTYGHLTGDECLREVASVIKNSIERSTDEVTRYGGEEFVVTLFNTPKEGAYYLAEKIRRQVENIAMYNNGKQISLTVSIGTATDVPQEKGNPDRLIALADSAMYDAKRLGRNRVCTS